MALTSAGYRMCIHSLPPAAAGGWWAGRWEMVSTRVVRGGHVRVDRVAVVFGPQRRFADDPLVAPGAQRVHRGQEFPARGGEVVVVPRRLDWYWRRSRIPAATRAFGRAARRSRGAAVLRAISLNRWLPNITSRTASSAQRSPASSSAVASEQGRPGDGLSGGSLSVITGVLSVPVIGTHLVFWIFGGAPPGHQIIGRDYWVHILVLPALAGALLLLAFRPSLRWPRRARLDPLLPITCAALVLLGTIAQINPVWLIGPIPGAVRPARGIPR
jgi:cytochrome b/b6/petB-like protein